MNSEAGRIATKLAAELDSSSLRFFELPEVKGRLRLGTDANPTNTTALCRFVFREEWRRWPPQLWSDERWIRRPGGVLTINWHIFPEGNLCYVLVPQWRETLAAIEAEHGTKAALVSAMHYILNNARYLLFHHLLGYRRKLADWPEEWPQYPHSREAAFKAYEKAKRRGAL